MPIITTSILADQDYSDIWQYIAADSPDAADAWMRSIAERLKLYAEHPNMGENRSRLVRGVRSFPVGDYIVFYRAIPNGIEVVRVLHGMRRLRRLLRQKPPGPPPAQT